MQFWSRPILGPVQADRVFLFADLPCFEPHALRLAITALSISSFGIVNSFSIKRSNTPILRMLEQFAGFAVGSFGLL
jgi:hypothetical protein